MSSSETEMFEHDPIDIVEMTGLRPDVVGDLVDKGWTFISTKSEENDKKICMWLSPSSKIARGSNLKKVDNNG